MSKPRVLLLCGGQSDEHEVSLSSARSVVEAASTQFEISPLVIDKAGRLLSKEASLKALAGHALPTSTSALQHLNSEAFDVVFPLLHGPYGEDGVIQGLLKLMGIAFVGSDVLGSAVGMDKLMMKAVFAAHQLPQVPYIGLKRSDWQTKRQNVLSSLKSLAYPLFVKPANLGSSVGISKATNETELCSALDYAGRFDRRIIVEQGIDNVRELEIGILGNDNPQASPIGEISYEAEFYDYESKYTAGQAHLKIPANIPEPIQKRCQVLALEAFNAIDAAGLARIDFFYDEQKQTVFLNEINTMPGFTTTSMYPKLWAAAGLAYAELISRLINLALERQQPAQNL